MKASLLFYIGLAIDALLLVVTLSNILAMQSATQGLQGGPMDGLSSTGRLALWLIPAFLLGLMGLAFWLKHIGKLLPANILVWIPALPTLAVVLLWGGLAVIFFVFSGTK